MVDEYGVLCRHLRTLISLEEWDAYARALGKKVEDAKDHALNGSTAEFDYRRGVVEGLRQALNLPQHFLSMYKG